MSNPTDASALTAAHEAGAVIIVRSRRQGYAIPIEHVREVAKLPHVSRIPNAPAEVRGVINFRGEVVPVVDLRVLLQQPSRREEIDELVQLLTDREQDHHNWIAELESCVREHRQFKLARDPHQCKFGRWYDTYKPEHAALAFMWSSLDRPHKTIHAVADQVLAQVQKGNEAGALELIQHSRATALSALVDLLSEIRRGLQNDSRELAVIMDFDGQRMALGVDSAEAVEDLRGVEFVPLPDALPPAARRLARAVMRWPDREEMVLCLDSNQLLGHRARLTEEVAVAA